MEFNTLKRGKAVAANVDWNDLIDTNEIEEMVETNPGDEVLTAMPWFNAEATRQSAEQLLTCAKPQSFLVRPSSQQGQYALSMTDEANTLIHAVIQQNENGHYFISGAPDPYPTIAAREFVLFAHSTIYRSLTLTLSLFRFVNNNFSTDFLFCLFCLAQSCWFFEIAACAEKHNTSQSSCRGRGASSAECFRRSART